QRRGFYPLLLSSRIDRLAALPYRVPNHSYRRGQSLQCVQARTSQQARRLLACSAALKQPIVPRCTKQECISLLVFLAVEGAVEWPIRPFFSRSGMVLGTLR